MKGYDAACNAHKEKLKKTPISCEECLKVLVEQFLANRKYREKWKERIGSCQFEDQGGEEEVNGEGCAWHQAHPAG